MTDRMDMALDDIITQKNNNNGRGGRQALNNTNYNGGPLRRRGGNNVYEPQQRRHPQNVGGIYNNNQHEFSIRNDKRNSHYSYDKPPRDDSNWTHDMYDNKSKRKPSDPCVQEKSSSVLKIDNLHWNVSENDLKELFSPFGNVVKCKIMFDNAGRSEGKAVVQFESLQDALNAKDEYDDREFDGQPMKITFSKGFNARQDAQKIKSRLGPPVAASIASRLGNFVGGAKARASPSTRHQPYRHSTNNRRLQAGSGRVGHTSRNNNKNPDSSRHLNLKKSKEELDAEMDAFISGKSDGNINYDANMNVEQEESKETATSTRPPGERVIVSYQDE